MNKTNSAIKKPFDIYSRMGKVKEKAHEKAYEKAPETNHSKRPQETGHSKPEIKKVQDKLEKPEKKPEVEDVLDPSLTFEDLELLIEECKKEIENANRELALLLVKQKILKRKITEWNEEKNWLEIVRKTCNYDSKNYLDSYKLYNGNKSIQRKYSELMERFKNLNIEDSK